MNLSTNDNHYPPKGLTFFGGTIGTKGFIREKITLLTTALLTSSTKCLKEIETEKVSIGGSTGGGTIV
jgi:hypothetical protein